MRNIALALLGLAALAFVLALLGNFTGRIMGTHPEGFSQASTNLSLLAIAMLLAFRDRGGHDPIGE